MTTWRKEMSKALAVLLELKESASYWSEYDVPIGIHERIDEAILELNAENEKFKPDWVSYRQGLEDGAVDNAKHIDNEELEILSNNLPHEKKVCENKIDGSCPLHNIQCNYPDCEA